MALSEGQRQQLYVVLKRKSATKVRYWWRNPIPSIRYLHLLLPRHTIHIFLEKKISAIENMCTHKISLESFSSKKSEVFEPERISEANENE